MKGENGVLLVALLLIVAIGFIGINYAKITGESVRFQTPTMELNPSVVSPGGSTEVSLTAGNCRMYGPLSVRDENDFRAFQDQLREGPMYEGDVQVDTLTVPNGIEPGLYVVSLAVSGRGNCDDVGDVSAVLRVR